MKIQLPKDSQMLSPKFTYGVATASFQIEGSATNRLPNIWDTFCQKPGAIVDQSDGLTACDHVNLWEKDLQLISSLNVDAYRLSISWGRVINQDGSLNNEGVDFYIKLLDRLKLFNIKAFVTLYHWDLPQHIEDNGGWLNRETAYLFSDYADKISSAFGNRVASYATLNEPFCSAYLGYEVGVHAPGIAKAKAGRAAAHHLLLAHGLAMRVLQKNCPDAQNGIVLNFTPCYSSSEDAADIAATKYADDYMNQWYIKPIMDGAYPDLLEALPTDVRPDIHDGDLDIISHPLDFLGVNYYTRLIYKANEQNIFEEVPNDDATHTDMGWEVYPKGLTELLISLNTLYKLPPVYITENGAAIADKLKDGEVKDLDRVNYYQDHLRAVNVAIEQGVDIRGYFAWSLMDNFEWAEGYLKRFGIVYVDYETQERTIKSSGLAYKELISNR
ncbi:beta-glucosidase [Shewanella eurypsychrophilus]|uniref:Beta-glucosidase n=1 Tax=Shewanella eurypsychrophilus TaxID=2593656 RepID=A0ABX6V7X8_9GAMM|nr:MULTISPECIES: GH1 family beta-glucosidase [Shewanella]QFU23397.1 beta-glucosidase [Shewanella sp. YLB-09]QPG58626.1 beta-glucosidase [Shewanella eurypsychrophilus]